MDRKLASVQQISNIEPIEGADRIEVVSVLGWKCVAKKGEFRIGDKCVYFEVDAFLPINPKFEFLRNTCYKKNDLMGEGFLLRTQRFRGQVSQGLALPLSILHDFDKREAHSVSSNIPFTGNQPANEPQIGDDVTEILGVRKWSMPEVATGSGTAIGPMPFGIPKTDEIRVQAAPELIEEFKGVPYYISTKMDGTSVTMYHIDGKFGVCGRNYEYADDGKSPFWKFVHNHGIDYKIKNGMAALGLKRIAVQGEFCGEGIQKNRLKLFTPEWFVFTVIDMETRRRIGLFDMQKFCLAANLNYVPIEEIGEQLPYTTVAELIERARGKYASGNDKEGIVIRPQESIYSRITEGPLSMKVINNDFLLM